jgi:hypothetical protein
MDGLSSIPSRGRNFYLYHSVDASSGAHPASYMMGIKGSFPGGQSGWGMKLTTHLNLALRSRMVELYLYSHIYLHGILLN